MRPQKKLGRGCALISRRYFAQQATGNGRAVDAVVVGAGIAGISAAYHLWKQLGPGGKVTLIDQYAPMTVTSDKSTEGYRNWFQGPGGEMVQFMNRSIDLLENLAKESENYFSLNRKGYMFVTKGGPAERELLKKAEESSSLGAGDIRLHSSLQNSTYDPSAPCVLKEAEKFKALRGVDILQGDVISKHWPQLASDISRVFHVRRCGWMSAQQLGAWMLQEMKDSGSRFQQLRGEVTGVQAEQRSNRVQSVSVRTSGSPSEITIPTGNVVVSVGPMLHGFCKEHFAIDLPVVCELHMKASFADVLGVFPRTLPFFVWQDPTSLHLNEEEIEALKSSNKSFEWMTRHYPEGVHARPEGNGNSVLLLWTYDTSQMKTPHFPPDFSSHEGSIYAEICLRGLTNVFPGLKAYLEPGNYSKFAGKLLQSSVVDGGYYCKAFDNRPIVGPISSVPSINGSQPMNGVYVCAGLSGIGIMSSQAAGELTAAHIMGRGLPEYANAFLPKRLWDPKYKAMVESYGGKGGQL